MGPAFFMTLDKSETKIQVVQRYKGRRQGSLRGFEPTCELAFKVAPGLF